jgi:16S rRNA processing protein RimM
MGHVKEPYGLQGWVKIVAYSDDPLSLTQYADWWLRGKHAGNEASQAPWRMDSPAEVGNQATWLIARFEGVTERNGALALKGTEIAVSRKSFPKPAKDEYYWSDLIGMQVVNKQADVLGLVAEVLDLGPHQVLRVKPTPDAKLADEILIPFVAAYIEAVKLKEKRVEVDWSKDYNL